MRRKFTLAATAIIAALMLCMFSPGGAAHAGDKSEDAEEYDTYMGAMGMQRGMMGHGMMGHGMYGTRGMKMAPFHVMMAEKVEIDVKETKDGVTVTLRSTDELAAKQLKLMAQMMKLTHEMMKLQMQAAPKPMMK